MPSSKWFSPSRGSLQSRKIAPAIESAATVRTSPETTPARGGCSDKLAMGLILQDCRRASKRPDPGRASRGTRAGLFHSLIGASEDAASSGLRPGPARGVPPAPSGEKGKRYLLAGD